jgi:hypothetical protein
MPQLNPTLAGQIDEEPESIGILDPGVYDVALVSVEARPGKVAPLWTWKFEIPAGQRGAGRQFYHNTSLSEAARFKVKETFDAFGVTAGTDTDLLIGRRVRALVIKTIAEQGKRQGQFVNQIQELYPLGGKPSGSPVKTLDPDDPTAARDQHPVADTQPGKDDEPPF